MAWRGLKAVGVGSRFGSPNLVSAANLQRHEQRPEILAAGQRGTTGRSRDHGMVTSMATKKVTITLDEAQLSRIRALADAGTVPSVSGFIQHAVGVALDDVAGWGAQLAEALRETGGPLTDHERTWADEIIGAGTPGARPAA